MPKCIIDGKEYEFKAGETVIEVADRNGIEIPRFCYHPGLSVVAQCRMCMVEVEKMPKLQTACSTPAGDNMIVKTKSDRVKQAQGSCMEFLLINHPLDCPICDKSGECDLQDNSFEFGAPDSRYEEQRRTYMDLDMGPVIKKNMNRCIHCTRCIRFCDEIGGYREMVALKRGNNTEITTVDGKPLETQYAGNLADVCPTGSLTLKDFRFKKRVWYLAKTPSVCEGCSQGCNIEIHQENNTVWRHLPRTNMEINKWWICDEGRFSYHYLQSETRVVEPWLQGTGETDWGTAAQEFKSKLTGKVLALIGSDLTNEEIKSIQRFLASSTKSHEMAHFGTEGVKKASDDQAEDKLLRRTSKTANLHGVEKLGIKAWDGSSSYDTIVVFRGGRAQLPKLTRTGKRHILGVGVFEQAEAENFDVILPGLAYAEKSGTVVNWQGKEQQYEKALEPRGQCREIDAILAEVNQPKEMAV